LNDRIENYNNFEKITKENNKKLKKQDQIEITIIIEKNKNHKLDLKDQIASHKNFEKRAKEKN
jgi:hypothetical protein